MRPRHFPSRSGAHWFPRKPCPRRRPQDPRVPQCPADLLLFFPGVVGEHGYPGGRHPSGALLLSAASLGLDSAEQRAPLPGRGLLAICPQIGPRSVPAARPSAISPYAKRPSCADLAAKVEFRRLSLSTCAGLHACVCVFTLTNTQVNFAAPFLVGPVVFLFCPISLPVVALDTEMV